MKKSDGYIMHILGAYAALHLLLANPRLSPRVRAILEPLETRELTLLFQTLLFGM